MKNLLVGDWMSEEVVTADVETSLTEAHKLMSEKGIRRLPVMKRGKLAGIVTRSDIRGAQPSEATSLNVWELNYLLANLKLKSIMTPEVVTVKPDTLIRDAAQLMDEKKIGALPVLDNAGDLVGILTESDIFRVLVSWFSEEIEA